MQRTLTISWFAASSPPLFSAKRSFAQILFLATKFISEKIPPGISWKRLLHRKLQRQSAESRQRALICHNFSTSVGRNLTIEPVIFPPALVFASPIQVLAVDKVSLRCDPILLQTMERLLCLLFLSSLILQEAVGKFLHRTHRSDQIRSQKMHPSRQPVHAHINGYPSSPAFGPDFLWLSLWLEYAYWSE